MRRKKHKKHITRFLLCILFLTILSGCAKQEEIYPSTKEQHNKENQQSERNGKFDQVEVNSTLGKATLGEKKEDGVYTYNSQQEIISVKQAVDLVADIVKKESGAKLKLIQNADTYYYQMNPRISKDGIIDYLSFEEWEQYRERGAVELGEQIIINKIECNDSWQDTMENGFYVVTIYEDIIDDIETGEGHQAITSDYAVDWKEQIIVQNYLWNDWYWEIIENRELD